MNLEDSLCLLRPEGLFTLCAITPEGGPLTGQCFHMPGQAAEAAQWARERNEAGANVYWTPNQTREPVHKKPRREDLTAPVDYVHVDIDPDLVEHTYQQARNLLLDERVEALKQFPRPPTVIIDSGNGIQAFWRVFDCSIEDAERINRRLIQQFGGDSGTWNADRLMRLPGTLNYPDKRKFEKGYPKKPGNAVTIYQGVLNGYRAGELLDILPEVEEPTSSGPAVEPPAALFEVDLDALELSAYTVALIREGTGIDRYPSRSEAIFGAMKDMVRAGVPDPAICRILADSDNALSEKALEVAHGDIGGAMKWIAKQIPKAGAPVEAESRFPPVDEDSGVEVAPRKRSAFPLTPVCDLLKTPPPMRWLVPGFLPPEALCWIHGDPAAGKSLLALDIAACVATGRDGFWGFGTNKGPVIYLAGEGHFGIRRRLKAWATHNDSEGDLEDAPLFVSDTGANMTDPAGVAAVQTAVDDLARQHGAPALIVIDTMHRNFGGGDENSAQDVGAFVGAVDSLRSRYDAAIIIVHHTGHNNKDRGRGSSAIRAAADAEYLLTVNEPGVRTLESSKSKDFAPPNVVAFALEQIELPWKKEDGEPETSVVLVPTIVPQRTSPVPRSLLPAFSTLVEAQQESGVEPQEPFDPTCEKPDRVVPLEAWRERFYESHPAETTDAKRKAFQRARKKLGEANAVGHWDGHYWPTPETGPWPELGQVYREKVHATTNRSPEHELA